MAVFRVRVIRGSLMDPSVLDRLKPKKIADLPRKEWISLDEVVVNGGQIRDLQVQMCRHYDHPNPWFLEGCGLEDKNQIVVAFGADDGRNGSLWMFDRRDPERIRELFKYAKALGIPKREFDFLHQVS